MEKSNPHLHAAFMEVVDNQIAGNDPPETRETLNRLISEGISRQDARNYMAHAVGVEVWDILKNKKEFNRERFVRNLKNLPDEPKE